MTNPKEKRYFFPEIDAQVDVKTARVYHFRWPGSGFGWAIFTICDETGELSIQSDWGDFHHRWNPEHTGAAKFSHFIAGWRDDLTEAPVDRRHYIMDKFGYVRSKDTDCEFNPEDTRKELRRIIGEAHWESIQDASPTERALAKANTKELCQQADEFVQCCQDMDVGYAIRDAGHELDVFFGGALYEHVRESRPLSFILCRDELLPRFFAYLREEIKREETVARFASTEPPVSPAQRAVMEESGLAVFAAVKCAHTEALAERLDATHKGEVKAGSGYFGALQTAADVAALRKKDEES